MKAAIVFVLLFATVLCRPAKRVSSSSSESSEEQMKLVIVLKKALEGLGVAPLQEADPTLDPTTNSTASTDSSDSDESDKSEESTDSTDSTKNTDSDETNSSESGEPRTTAGPTAEATVAAVTTPAYDSGRGDGGRGDTGRGDSVGHPSDYKKSIIYEGTNNIEKGMSPYKSYGKMDQDMYAGNKVSVYNAGLGNEVEKTMTVFKALQVHDLMEEDTSTPEVESQGLDATGGMANEPVLRQGPVEESLVEGDSSDSASSPERDSSEETAATPGAEDSNSTESQESDSDSAEGAITEAPVVITAK